MTRDDDDDERLTQTQPAKSAERSTAIACNGAGSLELQSCWNSWKRLINASILRWIIYRSYCAPRIPIYNLVLPTAG